MGSHSLISSDDFGKPSKKALRKKLTKEQGLERQRNLEMSASQASHASNGKARKKARDGERKMNQERGAE